MARSLEQLRRQYNSHASRNNGGMRRGPGGGPGRGRGPRPTGKPKNLARTVARLFGYIGNYAWLFILVIICMLLTTMSSLAAGYLNVPIINHLAEYVGATENVEELTGMQKLADSVISAFEKTDFIQKLLENKVSGAVTYIVAALIILAIAYVISIVFSYIQARLMLIISQNATMRIRNDLFNKMQNLPIRYFDSRPTGEIMSRYTNDIDNVDMMLNNTLTSTVSGVINITGTLVFMFTTDIWLTLVTLAFVPVFMLLASLIGKLSSKYYSGQQAALGAVNGYIEESITGQKVMKVFNHEGECVEEFGILNEDLRNKQFLASFFGGITGPIIGNTSQICYAVTVGVGGILMFNSGLSYGALVAFAGYSRQFARPIDMLAMQMSTIFSALAGAERVFAVMDETPEDMPAPEDCREPIYGDVVLENVTFGYVPGQTVLRNISLYAHPGQKIAFVGSTGAGKTTVTNLINRFYDVEEGTITVDGRPIKEYDREHLRRNIAMVLQDTHLFTGTVMENIRYGRLDATDEEVISAAKTASAHSFIMRLEHGYDTVLEGDGANLSQGQRQLLNIARAALSKAPILVLDEATSSVDTRTERHIEHGMDRLMQNRTTFVIAHRLSTVRNSNAIMVLERGEIIERGTHEDLLALGGRYYELYTGKRELD